MYSPMIPRLTSCTPLTKQTIQVVLAQPGTALPQIAVISENWHKAGLHTPKEIREKDRPVQTPVNSGKTGTSGPIDPKLLDEIEKAMNGWKKE